MASIKSFNFNLDHIGFNSIVRPIFPGPHTWNRHFLRCINDKVPFCSTIPKLSPLFFANIPPFFTQLMVISSRVRTHGTGIFLNVWIIRFPFCDSVSKLSPHFLITAFNKCYFLFHKSKLTDLRMVLHLILGEVKYSFVFPPFFKHSTKEGRGDYVVKD